MPVARAAFFATRLSPAPVLRIVRFADFTTFVVLDFLRLAILFPPVRYLVGPSPRPLCEAVIVRSNPHHHGFGFRVWKQSRNGTGLVRLSPVLRAVEMTGRGRGSCGLVMAGAATADAGHDFRRLEVRPL
jgi:hypothetical protein